MSTKPILFNTEMVRAILDGRKSCTRRLVKVPSYYPNFYKLHDNTDGAITGTKDRLFAGFYKDEQIFYIDGKKHIDAVYYQAPCKVGDIIYVRETWRIEEFYDAEALIRFKDGGESSLEYEREGDTYRKLYKFADKQGWNPSLFMPKEAARIWLKVTDVRVERLHDITKEQALKEGILECPFEGDTNEQVINDFSLLWNSTVDKKQLDTYGWNANPYVWVIEFERMEDYK